MIKKHKGGISIFLIIIVMSTVIFGGVFVDLTRVLVAKNKVRTATESAVRSTLADYSDKLVSEWGLFGLNSNDTDINANFKKYLESNLDVSNKENKANLINYEIINTSVTSNKNLGNPDVFQEKINEYSKYRAPVNLCLGVIDKFKAIFSKDNSPEISIDVAGTIESKIGDMTKSFGGLKEIKTNLSKEVSESGAGKINTNGSLNSIDVRVFDTLKNKVDSSVENSKNKIDKYKASIKDYKDEGDNAKKNSQNIIDSVKTDGSENGIIKDFEKNIPEIVAKENVYSQDISNYNESAEEKKLRKEQEKEIDRESKLIEDINTKTDNSKAKGDSVKSVANKFIDEAEVAAKDYNNAVKEYENCCKVIEESMKAEGINKSIDKILSYDIEKVKADLKRVDELGGPAIKNDEQNLKDNNKTIKNISNQFNNLKKALKKDEITDKDGIKSFLEIPANSSKYELIKDEVIFNYCNKASENRSFDDYCKEVQDKLEYQQILIESDLRKINEVKKLLSDDYETKQFVVKYEVNIKNTNSAKKEVEEKANIYNEKIDKVEKINISDKMDIDEIDNLPKEVMGEEDTDVDTSEFFDKINEIKDKINDMFNELTKTMPSATDVKNKDDELSGISGKSFNIFKTLQDKFNEIKKVITNPGNKFYLVDYIMSKCTYVTSQTGREHYFKWGEVEYIIYGKKSQAENILCAVGEIALIRLAINAVNYWITTPGELITRTVSAVVRGLARTALDMTTMLLDTGTGSDKGLIAICPSLSKYKVLSYSDHLRLLLLMKCEGNGGADALKRCIHATMKEMKENIATVDGNHVLGSSEYLREYSTEITANVEVDVDLYFIPLLLPDFMNFGSIHNGKYKVSSTITYGY